MSFLKHVFKTTGPVIIFPASGTGAWEAALVNTLSLGDSVLMCETGHFATLWHGMAKKLGLVPEFIAGDWRHGADPAVVEQRLTADAPHEIKAVCVVHNETSTGITSRIAEVRKAIMKPNSAKWCSTISTCRSAAGSAKSRARCSASDTSATSTT